MSSSNATYPHNPLAPCVTIDEVCDSLCLSEATIGRLVKAGRFPKPLKPGGTPNSKRIWPTEAIEDWKLRRDQQADHQTAPAAPAEAAH
jgi:predicted DNA-binding transcriptional regulator AlpA